jgi:hypothetical protein
MNPGDRAAALARWLGAIAGRFVRAHRVLPHERRLAAYAAIGMFGTLFLPWYQQTVIAPGAKLQAATATLTGWGAFSFVEAAVLVVSLGVLTLLVQRAEGKAFHLPGGDGSVIMVAGGWACLLVVWRIFDKQGTTSHAQYLTTSGIEWGIFVALATAAVMAYAGSRIRAAHRPEPPLPGDDGAPQSRVPHNTRSAAAPASPGNERSTAATASPGNERSAAATASPGNERNAAAPERGFGSGGRSVRSESDFRPGAPARPQGWLSARPEPRGERGPRPSTPPAPGPTRRRPFRAPGQETAASADGEAEPTRTAGPRPGEPPKPTPDDATGQGPLPPSSAAARHRPRPDEQLTSPLERED